MKKTTQEVMDLQETLSHDLLKNEILMLLIDLSKASLLRSEESASIRAETLGGDVFSGKVKQKNILHTAEAWQRHDMSERITDFLAAVAQWDSYEPKKEFNTTADTVRAMLPGISAVFKMLGSPSDAPISRTQMVSFFTSLLTIYDFVRALDEHDSKFDRYLKPV
jgi:hypothetical protein